MHPYHDTVKGYRPLSDLVPTHWQAGEIKRGQSARLHYTRTGGAKPALVLLHGVQANGLTWLRTAQALEADYDVVMPDFRGHGASSRLDDNISTDVFVQDTIAVIEALGLDRPYVVGHSMGADIAGRVAATYPVSALVLVDPALRNVSAAMALDPDVPPPWMQWLLQTMQALRTKPHVERMIAGLNLLPPGTSLWHEADYVSFVDAQAQFDLAMYRYAATMSYLFEESDVIERISCAVLLLSARQMGPGASGNVDVSAFQKHLREFQHIHFPDSGHFILFDQFERFVDVVNHFLREHQPHQLQRT